MVWWIVLFKEYLLIFRLIGPQSDYAISLLFQKSKKDSIYGRLYQNNMDGPRSFYNDEDALKQLVESENVAFVQIGDPIHFLEDYHCKVLHSNHLNLNIFQVIWLFAVSDIFCLERSCSSLLRIYGYEKTVSTYTIHSTWNKEDGRIRNHKPSSQEAHCIGTKLQASSI